VAGLSCKETKITFIMNKSLVHNHTPRYSEPFPSGGGELAGGEQWPEEMNKRRRCTIGLTRGWLVAVVWPEMAPVSGGGETAAAQPPQLEIRRGEV
jgi:hypothetical protein